MLIDVSILLNLVQSNNKMLLSKGSFDMKKLFEATYLNAK